MSIMNTLNSRHVTSNTRQVAPARQRCRAQPAGRDADSQLERQLLSRRDVILSGAQSSAALVAAAAATPPPAAAVREVLLPDGSTTTAYEHGISLSILALRGSVPSQWIIEYRTTLGRQSGFTLGQRVQLDDIFRELQDPAKSNSAALSDVATLGDSWLAPAIRQRLIQPIRGAAQHRWWRRLSPRWQRLMRRNQEGRVDPAGDVYGCPYRWGCALIAYRKDKLLHYGGHHIRDWDDLLQPQLKGRLALMEYPRELLAAALKSLHLSANAGPAELAAAGVTRERLHQRMRQLRKQAAVLTGQEHVRALQAGDMWAAVGWAQDLIALAERSQNIVLVAPASGTILWSDVWTVPHRAQGGSYKEGPSPLLPSWLEFCVMPGRIVSLPGLKSGASPQLLGGWGSGAGAQGQQEGEEALEGGEEVLSAGENYLPPPLLMRRSDFIEEVGEEARQLYREVLQA